MGHVSSPIDDEISLTGKNICDITWCMPTDSQANIVGLA